MQPLPAELPPITDERRQAVARWVEMHIRPVLHVTAENSPTETPQQEFELRDYQVAGWALLEAAREVGRRRALGNLATGLGKTFEAAVDAVRYREWCATQSPPLIPRFLYVSHQRDINEQAAKTFHAVMPDAKIAFFQTKKKYLPDADVTFATIQSLYSELGRFDPQSFEYIIWDESHHLEARTFKAVRDYFDPLFEHAITATLERTDGKDIQEYFGKPLYQMTLPEGIAEGHLADVDYHIVFDEAIRSKLQSGFSPKTLQEIKELFDEKPSREAIARNIEEEIERLGLKDPKTLLFCESIEEAEEMAGLLGGVAYHSRSSSRPQILKDFRSNVMRRITTRDMFNEGVDIPEVELIIFLRSTNSPTVFEQQLGRGLRRTHGKSKVYVLDFVANIERITRMKALSEAVQHRASQLEQRGTGDRSAASGEGMSESRLRIRTRHGSFDFGSIAIDLLERYSMLKGEEPRNGEVSMVEFAKDVGAQYITIAKLVEALGLPTTIRRFGNTAGKALPVEAQEVLRNRPELRNEVNRQGEMSVKAFAESIGVGYRTVNQAIQAYSLPTVQRKFTTKAGRATKPGIGISSEVQERLKQLLSPQAPPPQEGEVSVKAFARTLGIDRQTLTKIIDRHEIPTITRTFQNTVGSGLSAESQLLLSGLPELQNTPPQPGEKSVRAYAAELGISYERLVRLISTEEIPTVIRRFDRKPLPGLTVEAQQQVRHYIEIAKK